jgi:leucyl/phenylalanyl-tRNA--protein transferase
VTKITPELLLRAYASGVFPMADSASSVEIFWVDPTRRGIIPLNNFHVSRTLRSALRQGDYSIQIDTDFNQTVSLCAGRPETWINDQIFDLYTELHHLGFAHSLEVWRDNCMIGGVYGVAIGAAFFGESMFSKATNGSKIALSYLIYHLNVAGFTLFDTQFITPHLQTLGAVEIPRRQYQKMLANAILKRVDFSTPAIPGADLLVKSLNNSR